MARKKQKLRSGKRSCNPEASDVQQDAILQPVSEAKFTVLKNKWAQHKNSIFCNTEKIEKDSIYNTVKPKNMTRFSNIPTKAPKGNLPVTFNKKIRSSGYGTKPEALKYSKNKQKKKIIPKLFVTRDFYSTTLPLEMHEETEFLNKDPLHTKPITKIQYSNNGALLASAALDMTISVMKTPIFEDSFQASSFAGHNGSVNSLNFSLRDEYLLSCSSDKSAIVWSIDYRRGKKALIINNTKHSLSDDSDSSHQKNTKDNPHFTHDIKKASFYFEDRFITL